MKKHSLLAITVLVLTFFFHSNEKTYAAELLTNGGFETGNFTGWTITNASGSWQDWRNTPGGVDYCSCGVTTPAPTAPQDGLRDAVNGVTANANQQYIMYQQVTVPAGMTASLWWKDRFQMNLSTFCNSTATCGQAFYVVDITNTSGTVLQTLYSVTAPSLANTDTGWVPHLVNLGTTYAGQTIRIRFRSWGTQTFAGPGQAEIDAVSLQSPAIPTASNVPVSGRVLDGGNSGLSKVAVTITDVSGNSQTVYTNSFGYYKFDEVQVGQTYIISVNHRKYLFPESPRVLTVDEAITDLNFQASP